MRWREGEKGRPAPLSHIQSHRNSSILQFVAPNFTRSIRVQVYVIMQSLERKEHFGEKGVWWSNFTWRNYRQAVMGSKRPNLRTASQRCG